MTSLASARHRHLMIGSLPPPVGGTTVLFRQLVESLSQNAEIQVSVIDTTSGKWERFAGLKLSWRVARECISKVPACETVALHGSINGILLFAPVLSILTRLLGKKLVVRVFGGNFYPRYKKMPFIARYLFRIFVLNADLVLFETKQSVQGFKPIIHRKVGWYPNSRKSPGSDMARVSESQVACNYIFLGHIRRDKGVLDAVDAFKKIDQNVHLTIYGPLVGDIYPDQLVGDKVSYGGILEPSEVPSVLVNMDVLVLPTYYEGEGYPGVILEAYACGIPVITTNWRCIPEIVYGDSGILVEPGDIDALVAAVCFYHTEEIAYQRAVVAAKAMAKLFDADIWTRRYIELLCEI